MSVCVCVLCKILVTMKSKWREHDITIQLGLCAKVSAFYFSARGQGYSTMRHTALLRFIPVCVMYSLGVNHL